MLTFAMAVAPGASGGEQSASPGAAMGPIRELLSREVFGYSVSTLALGALVILLVLAVNTAIRFGLRRRERREDAAEPEGERSALGFVVHCAQAPLRLLVWALAVRFFLGPLFAPEYGAEVEQIAAVLYSVAIALFIYRLVDIVEIFLLRYARRTDTKLDDMLVPAIRKTLKILVVIVVGLHVYESLSDEPVTTLLAGLGIGGLAFALASQDTLKNLFGFVMILLDRPFLVGERIVFAGHDGAVESVGFRTTRIRRLDGHQVSVPNAKAADDVIHNIGRRPFIKRIMNVTVTYDTPVDKVERAVQIVREILDHHEGMDPDLPPQVYFNELNADSLNIIAFYWFHPPDYWAYLDHAQRVNLELMRRFEAEGIEFAFPTQTLYLAGDPNRELVLKHLNANAAGPPSEA